MVGVKGRGGNWGLGVKLECLTGRIWGFGLIAFLRYILQSNNLFMIIICDVSDDQY